MSIMKLLPFMYLVAKASAMWLPRSNQAHEITNIENCICPMKSPSIINKLDSNNSGVERLVIYVYRRPDTGEIVSFIPEKEHQRKIPDLPETNGRIHDEQNPSIKEIFEKSTSKDLRHHIRPNKPHHKNSEDKESLFVINGKLQIPKILNENNNEKYLEGEVDIPKWQIPVNDETSERHVKIQHINPYPRPIPGENTHKKTEIMIDNDGSEDNKQQHPILEDSTLDISSEYINKKPHTYDEYPVSVKPVKIRNQDLEDSAPESTVIQSFESQGLSEEKSSEPVIPDEIESPRHKEQSSFEDSIYIRPHRTDKNQIPFREQEIPEEIELPTHKEQTSFEDSVYIRPHKTVKNQISYREPATTDEIELPNRHREPNSFEDSIYIRPHKTGKTHISYREPATTEEIELPRHREPNSFEDSIYIRPHKTGKTHISYREPATTEEIELPRHKEQSSFEDSIYPRPHKNGKPQISYREPETTEEIELPRHREQNSFEDSIYIRPHNTRKPHISYREPATTEEIELPRHKEQSSFEDSIYKRPHMNGKPQISYRELATTEEIELPRHREQNSFDDSIYIRPHKSGKTHISYREPATTEEFEFPGHKEQSSFEDSIYIRPHINGKPKISYREPATPKEVKFPRHREQNSFEDSIYIRPHITGKSQIYYREQEAPEEIDLPRHKEQSSLEDSTYIRPHITGKNQISYREQGTPERMELPMHKEESSFEDSIYFRPHRTDKNQITYTEQASPEEIELPRHRGQSSSEDSIYIRPHITKHNQISYREQATPEEIELPRHKEQSSFEDYMYIRPQRPEKNQISFREDQDDMFPMVKRIQVPRKDKYGRIIGWIKKTIKTYKNGRPNTHDNWREYQINRHKSISHHYTHKGNWEKDSAFDEWLKEQLRITTLNGNRIPTSKADIMTLDRAIRNVLLQNGWLVTKHGTLVDGTGKTSSLNNLKLRPILVGKSYSYDNFIKKDTHKLDMSKKPYLEGLLFTMINPAKILGIVPLSITSSQTSRPYDDIVDGENRSPKRQKDKMKILPIEELVSFRKDSKSSKPGGPKSKPKSKGSKKKETDATHLKNALSEIQQSQHGKGTTTTIIQSKGKVHTGSESGKHVGSVVSEEVPDWRIIGGISATISGTPLDFKGRSGAPS